MQPATEFFPSTQDELRAFLVQNFSGTKRPIVPVGGGTSFERGLPLRDRTVRVSTARLDRIVEFAARDMTITVEAGISIARLDEILRSEGLRLPIDVPQWERATLGGAVAANACGPRRFGLGTFRDYVIGLTAVKADGQVFHSGGRVVKNVAGYDLCKLLVGSFGTLAIITQVTLKLKPIPESSALVCAAFADLPGREAAVAGLLTSQTRPVATDTLNPAAAEEIESRAPSGIPGGGPVLIVGYEGTQHETDWQIVTLLKELTAFCPIGLHVLRNADAGPLWGALTNFGVMLNSLVYEAQVLPSQVAELEEYASESPMAVVARAGNGQVFVTHPFQDGEGSQTVFIGGISRYVDQRQGSLRLLVGNGHSQASPNSGPTGLGQELSGRLKQTFDSQNLLPRYKVDG